MNFAPKDRAAAMLAVALHLRDLIAAFEREAQARGWEIVDRRRHLDGDTVVPMLALRRGATDVELHLANAIEDLVSTDREADPMRFDPGLKSRAYATRKIDSIAQSRLEVMEIALLPDDDPERAGRLRNVADQFEWIRIARIDGAETDDG